MSDKWDTYFLGIAKAVARNSSCMSIKIGAVLTKDQHIVATGYNGPPKRVPHCNHRIKWDKALQRYFKDQIKDFNGAKLTQCPRKILGFASGEEIAICPAVHAEANCIAEAARIGYSVIDTTMYVTCGIPCQHCLGLMINAGVAEIVCLNAELYDELSRYLIQTSGIKIRRYYEEEHVSFI